MKGGPGKDRFYLSSGKDTIVDASLNDGDRIVVTDKIEPVLYQRGDDVMIRGGNIRTRVLNTSVEIINDLLIDPTL